MLSAILSGCKKEEVIIPLSAKAGPDQTVEPLDEVTLDGSESIGPEGFTYQWQYRGTVPETNINFQGANTFSPTFTAPEAGLYEFTLTISHNGLTDEAVVLVQATGAIRIGGTLASNTNLKNIENNPDLPDYVIESDLIVPAGITLTIESNVKIEVNQTKGIIVRGILTNASTDGYFDNIELMGSNGWKGIYVDGGVNGTALINLSGVIIKKAGSSVFEGISEAAAIRTNVKSLTTTIKDGNIFELDPAVSGCLVEGDGALELNRWPPLTNSFYLIDADVDLMASAGMTFSGGAHLKFKHGRSLKWITNGNYSPNFILNVAGALNNPVIFEGESDTPGSWGGLVLGGNFNINFLQVKNGGEYLLPGASNKANIFFDFTSADNNDYFKTFINSTISGSEGYGVVLSNGAVAFDFLDPVKQNTFSGNTLGNVIKE